MAVTISPRTDRGWRIWRCGSTDAGGVLSRAGPPGYTPPAFPAAAAPAAGPDSWTPEPRQTMGVGGPLPYGAPPPAAAGPSMVPIWSSAASPHAVGVRDPVHEARIQAENARSADPPQQGLPHLGGGGHLAAPWNVQWSDEELKSAIRQGAAAKPNVAWVARDAPCKRALLVGINYGNTSHALRGSIRDVFNVQQLLTNHCGYRTTDVVTLTDETVGGYSPAWGAPPTRASICSAMYHLVAGTKSGDSLFFHFSGYGSQVRDVNGDEPDFMDEALVPTDSMHAGNVLDDDVHKLLVAKLRQGVHLTALFDTQRNISISYRSVLGHIQSRLHSEHMGSQKPQLSSSFHLNPDDPLIL
ncbi:hypothetical protein I4F81_009981 [Pyropia yezoensis]|uniref:Uncharacterized protein n=1 Tax=Pyropia yezoensis TaxID=2788 RepID=A0ACC3CC02_PYRYE|nr:hypothetical protein I4F81_009981 [Neopyropia yezoensis]